MPDIKYEISKEIGVISERKGWVKKLCLISWNGRPVKYDIREWATETDDKGETHMTKGLTLSKEEMAKLVELMNKENE